jgi:hypothetical protein
MPELLGAFQVGRWLPFFALKTIVCGNSSDILADSWLLGQQGQGCVNSFANKKYPDFESKAAGLCHGPSIQPQPNT